MPEETTDPGSVNPGEVTDEVISEGHHKAPDDLFTKQTYVPGKEFTRPVETCLCHYELSNISQPELQQKFPRSPIRIGFSNDQWHYLISRVLLCMNIDEFARIECPGIVNNGVPLSFDIRITECEALEDTFRWSSDDKMKVSSEFRAFGNELFRERNYFWAGTSYTRGLHFAVMSDVSMRARDEEVGDVADTRVNLYLNIAQCYINRDCHEDAILNLTRALRLDEKSVKALYRRAKCYLHLNQFECSQRDLDAAAALDPASKPIRELAESLRAKRRANDERAASAMARYFASLNQS